jgi:hypothetical protein
MASYELHDLEVNLLLRAIGFRMEYLGEKVGTAEKPERVKALWDEYYALYEKLTPKGPQ